MSQGDSLGDRMKSYEAAFRPSLPAKMPVIVRVDGRAFHTWTRGTEKPFDLRLIDAMDQVAIALCEEMSGAVMAYVQSDEISVLLVDYKNPEAQPWFGGVLPKMVSIAAATASATMTMLSSQVFPASTSDDCMACSTMKPAIFDARAFILPREDVCNYFIWRQQDWVRNSLQMLARSHFSHSELDGKNQPTMHEMLHQKGVNWAHLEPRLKNGRTIVRRPESYTIPAGPLAGETVVRNRWTVEDAPTFTLYRPYIEGLL